MSTMAHANFDEFTGQRSGLQELPAYGTHVSLVRRSSNTMFPTISNRNGGAAPYVTAPSAERMALPCADGGAGASDWLYPACTCVWRFVQSLTHTLCRRPLTRVRSGLGRLRTRALPGGTYKTLSSTGA